MPSVSTLEKAAVLWGIEAEYWDIFGNKHMASPVLIKKILASLGVDVSSEALLMRAVKAREQSLWKQPIPATVVLSRSKLEIPISLPSALAAAEATLTVKCEDGSEQTASIQLGALHPVGRKVIGKQPFQRKLVPLPELPLGYHHLGVRAGDLTAKTRLIVTPDEAYGAAAPRAGGLAVSVYSLRSARNWGCGDFTDLHEFLNWAASLGAQFVSLNPLHAIENRVPYNTSPYLPNSNFFRNFLYLDIERIAGFERSARARAALAAPSVQSEIAALRDSLNVEYERAARLKLCFLKLLFREFLQAGGKDHAAFRCYQEEQGELLRRFAIHSALDEAMHRANRDVWNWRAWPEPYRNPYSREVQAFAQQHWRSVLLYEWVQWQIELQLASTQRKAKELGMSIGLYHDLALAVDRFGADLWAYPDFYVDGCRVGAPPDDFSPKGQDWAFPPPNSETHLRNDYHLFAESIRRNVRHGGALRIDHVMRFFRLYWIPEGMDATEGTYVREHYEDLVRILALESVRNQVLIVGEDLGTVPEIVRQTLSRFGIFSYRLFYFEKDYHSDPPGRFRRPDEYPESALVSVSTHDLPTLAGFWLNRDIEARRAAGVLPDEESYRSMLAERLREKQKMLDLLQNLTLLPDWFPRDASQVPDFTGELHSAIIGFLASTSSRLFLLNQEDLFKDTEQQNLPGTTAEYPNWRHKMKYALEELSGELPAAYAAMFRGWLERTDRLR